MKVDNVLILAAGKGTRMGEIGTIVPKVLWPIFKKSILELEIDYAKKFNPTSIYINLYNYKDKVLEFAHMRESFQSIEFIEERQPLDIGGAIHNLAKKLSYKGSLLILNSDQFIMLNQQKLSQLENMSKKSDATLLVYKVDPKAGYGGLEIKSNKLKSLISKEESSKRSELTTYTGMSIVNLESLRPCEGESKFFESVANPQKMDISTLSIDDCLYWDFGTLSRYKKSIKSILSSQDDFISFLKETSSFPRIDSSDNRHIKIDEEFTLAGDELIFKRS